MSEVTRSRLRALDHRVPPPILFLLVAAAMLAAAAMLPTSKWAGPWSFALGSALSLLAAVSGPAAIRRFLRAGTTINPVAVDRASTLVTDGVYRLTRNPMYLAMAALLGALAAFAAQPVLVVGPLAFVGFITRFQIIPEERALQARFGEAYTAYCRTVRRWL